MAEQRYYPGWADRAPDLASYLERTYTNNGFDTQLLEIKDGTVQSLVIQFRETYNESWHKTVSNLTGMDTAATVKLIAEGSALSVEVGGGKWLDKGVVVGAASILSAGLLLLPAGLGAMKQRRLLSDLTTDIERYVRSSNRQKPEGDGDQSTATARNSSD